jgi:diguanylate cyclase (GGDEF)-like protein
MFLSAAGAVVLVAFVQESHRLAFRDELTGLPGRRALDEQLRALGPHYTIAMVDVDHFKKFNDTHGHDIGDQVLKLVAARLAEVGGDGQAFRYGGEEFSVLFPGKGVKEALPFLEQSRASIERYKMAVRGEERPRKEEAGIRRRGDSAPMKMLSVTVSMGDAEPEAERQPPSQVLKAADEALYRAKKGGRNRVST